MLSPLCRYIGSLEDLKSKFGTSYHLQLKMAEVGQSDAVHTEILNLFPHAARQERSVSMGCPQPGFGLGSSFPPADLAQGFTWSTVILQTPPQPAMLSHKMKNSFFCCFSRTSSLLTYKIPVADALPLSRSFSKLEAGKRKQLNE